MAGKLIKRGNSMFTRVIEKGEKIPATLENFQKIVDQINSARARRDEWLPKYVALAYHILNGGGIDNQHWHRKLSGESSPEMFWAQSLLFAHENLVSAKEGNDFQEAINSTRELVEFARNIIDSGFAKHVERSLKWKGSGAKGRKVWALTNKHKFLMRAALKKAKSRKDALRILRTTYKDKFAAFRNDKHLLNTLSKMRGVTRA